MKSSQFPLPPPVTTAKKWALYCGSTVVMTADTPEQYALLKWEKNRREKQGQRLLTIKPVRR